MVIQGDRQAKADLAPAGQATVKRQVRQDAAAQAIQTFYQRISP